MGRPKLSFLGISVGTLWPVSAQYIVAPRLKMSVSASGLRLNLAPALCSPVFPEFSALLCQFCSFGRVYDFDGAAL